MRDVRDWQIFSQLILLLYGVGRVEFQWDPKIGILMILVSLLTQWGFDLKVAKNSHYNWKSALATSLSLNLILRTQSLWGAILIAFLSIASKFLIKWKSHHIFNPSNLAIVVALAIGQPFWVSPGQWGTVSLFLFLVFGVGLMILSKSQRWDISLAFAFFYAGMVLTRALWLGDPMAVPIHHLQGGTIWVFTFFMISDPRTTPHSRWGRLLMAFTVASIAFYIHFQMYRYNGPLWGLLLASCFVPWLNRLFPGSEFKWFKGEKNDLQKLQLGSI